MSETGCARHSATSMAAVPSAIARGGLVRAGLTRCTCAHIAPSMASGRPMCTKMRSEKKRSFTWSPAMTLRVRAPSKTGSASSHSVVAVRLHCASWSQASQ